MPLIAQPQPPAGGALLSRLHAINVKCGYLPEAELRGAAEELGVPLSVLYSAAAFYAAFSFEPRGRHTVRVCLGTSCYIRGGERLLGKLKAALKVKPGETTGDWLFTLETVHCVGSCSMSPVVRVDGDTYGRLKPDRLPRILEQYRPAESQGAGNKEQGAGIREQGPGARGEGIAVKGEEQVV